MYSGTILRKKSGNFIGVHQKINRIARRNIEVLVPHASFPMLKDILHFEGTNGPDGLKRKSPNIDEPWHFIDPEDSNDTALRSMIADHAKNLQDALQRDDEVKAAFEAAWLAHAIVDGLTPAHHYPLADKIESLWGKPKDERNGIFEKNIIVGETSKETLQKNWEYWGAKGVFTTHYMFEWGVASSIKTARFRRSLPSEEWLISAMKRGLDMVFFDAVQAVYELDMYHEFWQHGWTTTLSRQARQQLLPIIIQTVTFAWYTVLHEVST